VNAVCPGYTETDLAKKAVANLMARGASEADARAQLARRNAQGRLLQPDEVAGVVTRLCAPGNVDNGQAILVGEGPEA
jgi:NAD(P)-dependent dehydrogenase (short-subunit alcohol dehydrogenase family)